MNLSEKAFILSGQNIFTLKMVNERLTVKTIMINTLLAFTCFIYLSFTITKTQGVNVKGFYLHHYSIQPSLSSIKVIMQYHKNTTLHGKWMLQFKHFMDATV